MVGDLRIIGERGLTHTFWRHLPNEMSPTIFREAGFRFYFFSREEPRMHIHVQNQHGEAKFWLTPHLELAKSTGLSQHEITEAFSLITEHLNDIHNARRQHFPR